VIDMGRNYTGYFQIDLRGGKAGQTVTFEIANRIEPGMPSCFGQKSEYIFGESGKGTFTNRFNVAGGRWITVGGAGLPAEPHDIAGHVITSDRRRVSSFECSNPLLNRIYKMNLDTYLANTLDGILMDCPHRERRGWGEVTVAACMATPCRISKAVPTWTSTCNTSATRSFPTARSAASSTNRTARSSCGRRTIR
jgi:alpha-L-rhamnosidase